MTRGALSVCFCWDGPWAEVFPWIIHTTGMDYPAPRWIRKKFGQLAIARDHMTICVDDRKGPHSSSPWQFFPVRYFSNLPFGLQCSQRLFVSVIFHAHPALLYRQHGWFPLKSTSGASQCFLISARLEGHSGRSTTGGCDETHSRGLGLARSLHCCRSGLRLFWRF